MTLNYDPHLKQFARDLRNNSTKGEVLLWMGLRAKALGVGFNRQKPIGHYIADFYCREARLVVEADGITHTDPDVQTRDSAKDTYLAALGIEVMRIDDAGIFTNLSGVLEEIKARVEERRTSPLPPHGGG